ncbi:MAG: JAB domain-containing protein [Budvicia sp.]|nr:JAB domain-containing protein [Budvicia sp.]
MQRILLRENKIDKEKEHFWVIGMNLAGYILHIELIALGSVREVTVEPMNVFRVAVMKNATRIIAVHNHPAGTLVPSDADKDITDRLIQVGKILNIALEDHLIVTPISYASFKAMGLMDELEASVKYAPTYQLIDKSRQEEKAVAKKEIKIANNKADNILSASVNFLTEKDISVKQIAEILGVTIKEVNRILNKKK